MIYKIIPDMDTLVLCMQRGEVDILWVVPREHAIIDRLKGSGCRLTYINRPTYQMLFMNNKKKPFDDVRVRRAIAHGIDKDSLVKYVFSGMAERLDSLVPKGYFGHTEAGIPRYEFDPGRAKELLSQAGYPNGFEIQFDTFQSPSWLPLATAIAEQLRKVNISAKLEVTDQSTHQGKISKGLTDFSLYLPAFQPDADLPLMRFFHSSAFSPGTNVCKYDKLDDLIEKARRERGEKKRLEYYYQIQKRIMEDIPAVPMMMLQYPTAYKSNLSGVPEIDFGWGLEFYYLQFMDK